MKKSSDLQIPYSWENRRPALLERFFYIPPQYEEQGIQGKLCWETLFNQEKGTPFKVAIEYCSGNGLWIANRAKKNPETLWVAVEKRFDRARKIWLRSFRENLFNLFVVCGEGVAFSRHYVEKGSVSEVFVNFPDPWPKKRHAKHRLIRKEFIEELEKILKKGAKATFVTDDSDYALEMLELFGKTQAMAPLLPTPHFTTSWDEYGSSYFDDLWKKKGRNIHYLPYEFLK